MTCPSCSSTDTQVRETRTRANGATRRRRHCNACHQKFTTCEVVIPNGRYDFEVVAVPTKAVEQVRAALGVIEKLPA